MTGFGNISKDAEDFDKYEPGTWIQFDAGGVFYGKLQKFDIKKGEVIFDALSQYVLNEKGYVLGITEEPTTFHLSKLSRHRAATKEEVDKSIELQSMWYRHFGKMVTIPVNNIPYTGKIHQILRDSVELLPFLNREGERWYVEDKEPLSLGLSAINQVLPRADTELDRLVKELSEQNTSEAK